MCQANNHGWRSIPGLHRPVKSRYCTIEYSEVVKCVYLEWPSEVNMEPQNINMHKLQNATTNFKRLLKISKHFHKVQDEFTKYKILSQILKQIQKFENEFTKMTKHFQTPRRIQKIF